VRVLNPWNEENTKTPTLPKSRRVGHPEKLNKSFGDYLLEWYNSILGIRQLKKAKGSATRPTDM
jgi:hypothetical protein